MKKKPCQKRRYATRKAAEAAISAMAQKFGSFVFKEAYRCAKCKGKAHHGEAAPSRASTSQTLTSPETGPSTGDHRRRTAEMANNGLLPGGPGDGDP
jgi:hypothetical protein